MIKAVIFDWAGTTVDYGCQAPAAVLQSIFTAQGVELSPEESRHGMGLFKKDQIRAICDLPRVRESWRERHGRSPAESEIQRLFEAFIPAQLASIEEHSNVIEGVPEIVDRLRARVSASAALPATPARCWSGSCL